MKKMIIIPYEEYLELTSDVVKFEEQCKEYDKKLRISRIIEYFGVDAQKRKLGEECDELKEAISDFRLMQWEVLDGQSSAFCEPIEKRYREHIVEETADVLHVLLQLILYYKITQDEIEKWLWLKNDRTNEIIDDEIRKREGK